MPCSSDSLIIQIEDSLLELTASLPVWFPVVEIGIGKDNCEEQFGVFQIVRGQTQLSLGGILSTGAEVWSEVVTDTSELWLLS